MALELYMLGVLVHDMSTSLDFYRRLGLAIPEGSEGKTHVEIKMGRGLTFFLDSRPSRWDPWYPQGDDAEAVRGNASDTYRSILEFYLRTQDAVDAKYAELTGCGYRSHREPYESPIGMYFAMVADPDDNIILLSGKLKEHGTQTQPTRTQHEGSA